MLVNLVGDALMVLALLALLPFLATLALIKGAAWLHQQITT
jgi:hypothetical protein